MSVRWLWRFFLIFGLVATLLLIIGLFTGVRDILSPKGNEIPQQVEATPLEKGAASNKIQIVALGDSLTRGTGDETGKGYAGSLKEQLASNLKKEVFVLNQGINGYRSEDLLKDLQTKEDIRKTISEADVVVLSIGGNDLFNPGSEDINPDLIRKRLPTAEASLEKVVATINSINSKAPVLYMGLYNAFSDLPVGTQSGAIVKEWNNRAIAILAKYPHTIYVQTEDLFVIQGRKYLSSDHYHPNGEGYRRIALRMAQVLE